MSRIKKNKGLSQKCCFGAREICPTLQQTLYHKNVWIARNERGSIYLGDVALELLKDLVNHPCLGISRDPWPIGAVASRGDGQSVKKRHLFSLAHWYRLGEINCMARTAGLCSWQNIFTAEYLSALGLACFQLFVIHGSIFQPTQAGISCLFSMARSSA